jgi:enoyl-CoA hydratase
MSNSIWNCIKFEEKKSYGILTLSRPEALNALNSELLNELDNFLTQLDSLSLRGLIVTGEGKSFVAGADIKELSELNFDQALTLSQRGQSLFNKLESLPMPVIAAVNGFALGGGLELALACDFIIAGDKAKFALPEVGLGLIPGYGGTQRLSRVIGLAKAKRMILTGEMIDSQKAKDWGLVTDVVTQEELLNNAESLLKTVSSKGPFAISQAKEVVMDGFDCDLLTALAKEQEAFAHCFNRDEYKEGVTAFLEKRKPQF